MANINTESSLMVSPEVNFPRYLHQYTVEHQTTFNLGQIVPIYINTLVMPGETIRINARQFYKLTTSLFPTMGTLHADIYAFCDNYQNLWEHSKEFYGEDLDNPQEVAPEYTIPQIIIKPTDSIEQDDLLHRLALPYMGANPERQNIRCERLSYNHYCNMYNWYFRDQNYIAKIPFSKGDEDIDFEKLHVRKMLQAARKHDFFMGTPKPQKGEPELLPIGTEAPVIGNGYTLGFTNGTQNFGISRSNVDAGISGYLGVDGQKVGEVIKSGGDPTRLVYGISSNPEKSGLITDLSKVLGSTLNAFRLTATMQQIKEMLLFYGGRINEVIKSQYGVTVPEGIIQQTEFLGSAHCELNMDTVLQTSQTTENSPLGDSAGYSTTFSEDYLFEKSFTYWSVLSIVVIVRQKHTYCQGLALQHQKKRKYDFYNPMFKGLGAQPRPKSIIYLTGTETDNDVWNFAPAWQEYKFELDRATGLMAPNVPNNLAVYNYTDMYENVPNSGEEWINEPTAFLDRTLAVQSTQTPQFIANFQFDIERINTVPNFILPGIDKI